MGRLGAVALVTVGLMLMTVAAVRAQAAYSCRFDSAGVSQRFARGAILYAFAGTACFFVAKVMR